MSTATENTTENKTTNANRQKIAQVRAEYKKISELSSQMSHLYYNFIKPKRANLKAILNTLEAFDREENEKSRTVQGKAKRGRPSKANNKSLEDLQAATAETGKLAARAKKSTRERSPEVSKTVKLNPNMDVNELLGLANHGIDPFYASTNGSAVRPAEARKVARRGRPSKASKEQNKEIPAMA